MSSLKRRLSLPPWLRDTDPEGIIISARLRLARNVADAAFPGWAGDEEGVRLCRRLLPALESIPSLADGNVLRMEDVGALERQILRERHLISTELAGKGAGSAVLVAPDESLSVMVNEEDHLRIQGLVSGSDLKGLWERVDALDTAIEARIPYAASARLGYLTACPSNVGTGMRASVMLHLPGLRLAEDADKVVKALSKMGMAVRGLLGEGTDALGSMYQVSNQITLGQPEPLMIARLMERVGDVRIHELRARQRLRETRPCQLRDRVARAVALLTHAQLLGTEEALDLLSGLRLGLALNWLKNLDLPDLNELFLLVQPAHLQKQAGRALSAEERDETRARLARERLAGIEWI